MRAVVGHAAISALTGTPSDDVLRGAPFQLLKLLKKKLWGGFGILVLLFYHKLIVLLGTAGVSRQWRSGGRSVSVRWAS